MGEGIAGGKGEVEDKNGQAGERKVEEGSKRKFNKEGDKR